MPSKHSRISTITSICANDKNTGAAIIGGTGFSRCWNGDR